MADNNIGPAPGSAEWDFPTLAYVWDYQTRAIIAGADRLASLAEADRADSLVALSQRVRTLAGGLDDGWLVFTACFMVDDLYKSYFYQFRWDRAVHDYIAATAGVVVGELVQRGFVLHYVVDSTQPEAELDEKLTYIPAVFEAADLFVTGPQLMALELMQQLDHRPRDVTAIPLYRGEGHKVADELIARCHREHRSSVYLNLDLDDDTPALSLDVALSHSNTPGTIAVFRDQPPVAGSVARLAPPPGVKLPDLGGRT
jgi:hypothetical protein